MLAAADCSRAASCKIPPQFAASQREPPQSVVGYASSRGHRSGLHLPSLTSQRANSAYVLFAEMRCSPFCAGETLLETSIILESARISKGHLSGEVREILTALKAPLFKVEPDISTNNGHPLLGLGEMSERISTRANGARAATSLP